MRVLSGTARGPLGVVGNGIYLILLIVISVSLARAVINDPSQLSLVLFGGLGVVTIAVVAFRWPERALQFCFLLALFGNTKFRGRSTTTLLRETTTVDAQIGWEVSVSTVLVMVALIAAYKRVRSLELTLFETVLGVFALYALLSVTWSPVTLISLVRACQLLALVFFSLVAVRVLGAARCVHALLVAVAVYVTACAFLVLGPFPQWRYYDGLYRFSWFRVHPIDAGTWAGIGALAMWIVAAVPTRWRYGDHIRLVAAGVAWFLTLVLFQAQARGPAGSFLAAIVAVGIRSTGDRWLSTLLSGGFIAVVMAVMLTIPSPQEMIERGAESQNRIVQFIYRGQSAQDVVELNGRAELWAAVQPLIDLHPIRGNGFVSTRGLQGDLGTWARFGYAHNAFVQTMVDFGVVGILFTIPAFLSALFTGPFRAGSPRLRRARAMVFGATVFLLVDSMITETFAAAPDYHTLVFLVCIFAAERLRKDPSARTASIPVSSPRPDQFRQPSFGEVAPSYRRGLQPRDRLWESRG